MAEQVLNEKEFAEFLQSTPPFTAIAIKDLAESKRTVHGATYYTIATPTIQLHCDQCEGTRFFQCRAEIVLREKIPDDLFLVYVCKNCNASLKTYALCVTRNTGSVAGTASKYGEAPMFGPQTPARVITLIGRDRDLFLKGRRAENQGLGIGSFAYYRRVVENQKVQIIQEITKACAKLGASPDVIAELNKAEKETQFSTAIDQIKAAIPDSLQIHGRNPLTLLHSALSEGLHEHTDEECLEMAKEIRLVLTELAERLSQALKEDVELKQAVTRLLNRRTKAEEKKQARSENSSRGQTTS